MPEKQQFEKDETDYTVSETSLETSLETSFLLSPKKEESKGLWKSIKKLVSGDSDLEYNKGRELRKAVRAEDITSVKNMIQKGYGVNEIQEGSLTCIAARRQNLEMLQLLIQYGVDINRSDKRSQTSKNRTALQEATKKGWLEGVELILNSGANIDFCEENDVTALHLACRLGFEDIVFLLLKNKADPCGSKKSTTSPLHETSSAKIMQMLLEAGASVNQKDKNKCTPLHLQVYFGRSELVEILLKAGANINAFDKKGRTPIFLLGSKGNVIETFNVLKKWKVNNLTSDLQNNNLAHALSKRVLDKNILINLAKDYPNLWLQKNNLNQTPFDILELRHFSSWIPDIKLYVK